MKEKIIRIIIGIERLLLYLSMIAFVYIDGGRIQLDFRYIYIGIIITISITSVLYSWICSKDNMQTNNWIQIQGELISAIIALRILNTELFVKVHDFFGTLLFCNENYYRISYLPVLFLAMFLLIVNTIIYKWIAGEAEYYRSISKQLIVIVLIVTITTFIGTVFTLLITVALGFIFAILVLIYTLFMLSTL